MPNHAPRTRINMQEVMTRNTAARQIIVGFSAAAPTLTEAWRYLETALADAGDLAAEVARLVADMAAVRLDHANLLAAARAALAADRDGEPDPLAYLRDEVDAPQQSAETHRGQP